MACVAKPMIWSYLRTGSPTAIGAIAILCPRITRARAVTPATAEPSGMGSTATTTLSFCERRTVRGVLIWYSDLLSLRAEPGQVRVAAVPGGADDELVNTESGGKFRHIEDQVCHVLGLDHARPFLGRHRGRPQI